MSEPLKTCTGCGIPKPIESFSPQNSPVTRNLRRARCKACTNLAGKRWRDRKAAEREERFKTLYARSEGENGKARVETSPQARHAPAITPLADCACPIRIIDGQKWRAHQPDCVNSRLFVQSSGTARREPVSAGLSRSRFKHSTID